MVRQGALPDVTPPHMWKHPRAHKPIIQSTCCPFRGHSRKGHPLRVQLTEHIQTSDPRMRSPHRAEASRSHRPLLHLSSRSGIQTRRHRRIEIPTSNPCPLLLSQGAHHGQELVRYRSTFRAHIGDVQVEVCQGLPSLEGKFKLQ
eukprot:Lithocolla_globosa_v1_NODE_88_length_6608_cov_12.657409.p6 type:complete len:145 gc:universal NODE_88_length_6608_cov_12.657409:4443-4877(+)